MLDLQSVLHFSVTVSNVKKSIRFYREFLGFELWTSAAYPEGIREEIGNYVAGVTGYPRAHLRMAMLRREALVLELVEYVVPQSTAARAPDTFQTGSPHIAFRVKDLEREWRKILEAKEEWELTLVSDSVIQVDAGPNRGGKAIYFKDRDGITIELAEPNNRWG